MNTPPMIGSMRPLAAIFVLLGVFRGTSGDAFARQPSPVQKRSCDLPEPLRGVTGHVLVRYTVNEAGKVNFVKPLFVVSQPPDRETDLADIVSTCLRAWAYPASDRQGPGHASVEMIQAFHCFRPAPPGGPSREMEGGRRIPMAHIEEMAVLRLDLAKRLLAGPDYAETPGRGYVLLSNVKKKERDALSATIDAATAAFDQIFPGTPAAPQDARVTVLMFRTEDEFNQVAAFDRIFLGPKPAGQYSPGDRTAYAFASKGNHPMRLSRQALAHEVTHHLVHVRLAGGSRSVPNWVDEGIASYVELLRPAKDGALDPFRFQRGRQAEGSFYWKSPSDRYLEAFATHRKSGDLPDFGLFLRGRFGPIDADLSYGLSWILVHYFMTGDRGTLKERFLAWVTGSMGTEFGSRRGRRDGHERDGAPRCSGRPRRCDEVLGLRPGGPSGRALSIGRRNQLRGGPDLLVTRLWTRSPQRPIRDIM